MKSSLCVLAVLLSASVPGMAGIGSDRAKQAQEIINTVTSKPTEAQYADLAAKDVESFRAEENMEIAKVLATLAIGGRSRDPFGNSTSMNLVSAPAKSLPNGVASASGQSLPEGPQLRDAVFAMRVVGVNAQRGEIYCGSRIIKTGDSLMLGYSGKSFRVKVISISPEEVAFEGIKKEVVLLPLSIVPSLRPRQLLPSK
jgi:hypothetical protein